ncbi:MAG: hypothetical protein DMF51_14145 [Acidobacteria bacterium]|nr:MAG: hypothetical protein DMF51_14145 [Acidobacteriota bacterium]
MRTKTRWSRLILAAGALNGLFLGGRVLPALADDADLGSTYGRVRFLEGDFSVQRTGQGEVAEGTLNSPVTPGDRLTTSDGRAEIGLADGTVLWLDGGTRLDVRNLADIGSRYDSTDLLALEGGALRIEVPEFDSKTRSYRVDTEAGSVYLLSGGSFRIEIDDGSTTLYSFRGVAELSGDDGSVLVRTGERSSVQSGRIPSDPRRFNTARLDDFDRFVESRQEAYLRHDSGEAPQDIVEEVPNEVHPYVNELSYYGSWRSVPDYGWVWRPVYSGSWGPYVNGYWTWCPTGWVWVSYDPWGWAPYHFGRWDFVVDVGWCWIPGRIWSGAWVSFAVGPSYIGWCPLNYYNRPVFHDVTIVNAVNVNVNRLEPRGWRFVPVDRFADPGGRRPVLRPDRLPRGTEVVISSKLPRFDPKDVSGRPDRGARLVETVRANRAPLPVAFDRDNRPVPFRNQERAGEARNRRVTPAGSTQAQPRVPRGRPNGRPTPPADQMRPVPQGPMSRPLPRPDRSPAIVGGPQGRARNSSAGPDRPRGGVFERPHEPARPPVGVTQTPRGNDRRQQPGSIVAPRSEPAHPEARRPAPRSDLMIERLFNGVRGDRGRVEPPHGQTITRPPAAAPQPPRRPEPKPAPPRPQPPKEHGNEGHRH